MIKRYLKNRYQKGSAIIEIVMIIPFMILVFFMLIELGVAHINQSVLTNAARSAAREAARGKTELLQEQAANFALESLISWFDSSNIRKCNEDDEILKCDSDTANQSYTIEYKSNYHLLPVFMRLTGLNDSLKNKSIFTTIKFKDISE